MRLLKKHPFPFFLFASGTPASTLLQTHLFTGPLLTHSLPRADPQRLTVEVLGPNLALGTIWSCLSWQGPSQYHRYCGLTHRFLFLTVLESGKSKRKVLANSVSGKSWLSGSQNAALSVSLHDLSLAYIYICLGKGAVGERKQAFSLRCLLF